MMSDEQAVVHPIWVVGLMAAIFAKEFWTFSAFMP